jgi:hypothetical protein
MKINFDKWQQDYFNTKGSKILVSGRQTGKSTIAGYDAADYALKNPNSTVLIISRTERQAEQLFIKTLLFIELINRQSIKRGKDRPTKSVVKLKNGSVVRCLPTGLAGEGIRGYTIHRLICDEAQLIGDDVFAAVTPMLLTTGGDIVLLGTPMGKQGYFWEAFKNELDHFKVFHVNSEKVIKDRPISESWQTWQRDAALQHLDREHARMSEKEYAQEYLGMFIEDLMQLFSDDLIKSSCTLNRQARVRDAVYYLGVDVARLGKDESTFEILRKYDNGTWGQVENITTKRTRITDTTDKVIELNNTYNFKKIYIDSAGVGAGVFDFLLRESSTKRKVISIENASRSLSKDDKQRKKILKEDLYMNFVSMLEKKKLKLLNDDGVMMSLRSVQFEYMKKKGEPTNLRIFGNYTHIVEGLIRAAWAGQDKSLSIWAR